MKKRNEKLRRIGLTTNPEKGAARRLIRGIAREIDRDGHEVLTDRSTAPILGRKAPEADTLAALSESCDLLIVFGGDGTMLGAARAVAGVQTPILGVNIGGLGFLTALPGEQLSRRLEQLWAGEFEIEERWLMECTGELDGSRIGLLGLNDFVVSRGATSRLIELEVKVNGNPLTNYRCDGLIVGSPTGSTAYSLAAGGAIVAPDAPVLTITPICPHTLSNRSVIVSSDSIIEVSILSRKVEMILTADGQVQLPLVFGDKVSVRKSPKSVRLLRLPGTNFFATLRQKLHWRGSPV